MEFLTQLQMKDLVLYRLEHALRTGTISLVPEAVIDDFSQLFASPHRLSAVNDPGSPYADLPSFERLEYALMCIEGGYDTQLRIASETENADLLWGLKGGGGNFGVVTSFEFKAYPVGPNVMLFAPLLPAETGPAALRAWRDFMRDAPEEFGASFLWWSVPPLPFVPDLAVLCTPPDTLAPLVAQLAALGTRGAIVVKP